MYISPSTSNFNELALKTMININEVNQLQSLLYFDKKIGLVHLVTFLCVDCGGAFSPITLFLVASAKN